MLLASSSLPSFDYLQSGLCLPSKKLNSSEPRANDPGEKIPVSLALHPSMSNRSCCFLMWDGDVFLSLNFFLIQDLFIFIEQAVLQKKKEIQR